MNFGISLSPTAALTVGRMFGTFAKSRTQRKKAQRRVSDESNGENTNKLDTCTDSKYCRKSTFLIGLVCLICLD